MKLNLISKSLSLLYLIYFAVLLCLSLSTLIKLKFDTDKYGVEMPDTLLLIFLILSVIYVVAFSVWSFTIYKRKGIAKTTIFELLVIFLFGILLPIILFGKFLR